MAKKYGFEWDKITDDQVKGPDKTLDRKGVDLIIATKDVSLPSTSRYGWTTYIKKGQLLSATIKGKRVWIGRHAAVGTGTGRDRSFVGLDKRGFANVKSILGIDGAVVYHIDPEGKSRGARDVRASREQAKKGATALMNAKDVKAKNKERYQAALRVRAGAQGKGALIKMIDEATKMFETVLKEKLAMLKKGLVSTDNWSHDSWRTVSRAHEEMIKDFQYWMQEAANKEDATKKGESDSSIGYYDKAMNRYALSVKQQFNRMKNHLSKIDKSKEYKKVTGRGW